MSSNGDRQKARLAALLGQTLGSHAIDHAFVHGIDDPNRIGRDLDVLVRADQLRSAAAAARGRLESDGWRVRVHRRLNGHFWCFAAPAESLSILEFDLFPRIRWGPVLLVEGPTSVPGPGGLRVDPWAGFVKRILIQLLAHRLDRFRRSPERLVISESERLEVPGRLHALLGPAAAEHLWRAIVERRLELLRNLVPSLRRALLRRALTQPPGSTVRAVLDWLGNEWASSVAAAPVFPTIAIAGVDGVGKSSVVRATVPEVMSRFPAVDVEVRHWRPGLLPPLGGMIGRSAVPLDDSPRAPRRHAGPLPTLRLAYYGLDFLLGGIWRDRRAASRLNVVLYDRCALDMRVDPLRFGLPSARGTRLLWRLSRRPDFVVLLVDDPERIRARKPELEVCEIQDQQARWLELAREGTVGLVLSAKWTPESAARKIVDAMITSFLHPAHDSAGAPNLACSSVSP